MYAELQMELETKEINYRQSSNLGSYYGKYFSRICSQTTWKPVKSL